MSEADEDEYIIKPNGSNVFGRITQEMTNQAKQKNVKLSPGDIRLKVGRIKTQDAKAVGLMHAKKHDGDAKNIGYDSIEDLISDVASSFDTIIWQPAKDVKSENADKHDTFVLLKTKVGNTPNKVIPVYFTLENDKSGGYYLVISAFPRNNITKGTPIYSRMLNSTTVASNGSAPSVDNTAGVESDSGRATVKQNVPLDNTIFNDSVSQEKENVNTQPTETKETTQKSGSFNAKKTFVDELGIPYTKAEGEAQGQSRR